MIQSQQNRARAQETKPGKEHHQVVSLCLFPPCLHFQSIYLYFFFSTRTHFQLVFIALLPFCQNQNIYIHSQIHMHKQTHTLLCVYVCYCTQLRRRNRIHNVWHLNPLQLFRLIHSKVAHIRHVEQSTASMQFTGGTHIFISVYYIHSI